MNTNKKAMARHAKIRDLLHQRDVVTISEFCQEFGCSIATIRNDLTFLEREGALKRVRGGAISTEGTPRNTTYASRIHLNEEAKKNIARKAADLIHSGMTVILDPGTTCQYLAREILEREIPCTVCTSGLSAIQVLAKASSVELISTGGGLDRDHSRFTGGFPESLHADLYFLSPDGVSGQEITGSEENETSRKKEFMRQAEKTIVLADTSKHNRTAEYRIGEAETVISEK